MKNKLKSHGIIDNIAVTAFLEIKEQEIEVNFVVEGALSEYIFPKKSQLKRLDELWKETCFELLLASDDEVYYELNFSSSLGWNFYLLNTYRAEPVEVKLMGEVMIRHEVKDNTFSIFFKLKSENFKFKKFTHYNLATILLRQEKERTFWTIKHLKSQPDFHSRESFLEII